ncbi:hypothetical protein D3C76_1467620 [compost metagenome]
MLVLPDGQISAGTEVRVLGIRIENDLVSKGREVVGGQGGVEVQYRLAHINCFGQRYAHSFDLGNGLQDVTI